MLLLQSPARTLRFIETPPVGETTRNFAHRPSEPSICSTRQPESLRHLDTETSRRCFGAIPLIEASRACAFRTTPRRGAPSLRQVERVTLRPHIALRNNPSSRPRDTHTFGLPPPYLLCSIPSIPWSSAPFDRVSSVAARRQHRLLVVIQKVVRESAGVTGVTRMGVEDKVDGVLKPISSPSCM